MDIDNNQLLRIYRAVGGPVAKNNVDKAIAIIKTGGNIPGRFSKSEIRTYFRIKEHLKEHGII